MVAEAALNENYRVKQGFGLVFYRTVFIFYCSKCSHVFYLCYYISMGWLAIVFSQCIRSYFYLCAGSRNYLRCYLLVICFSDSHDIISLDRSRSM